MANPMSTWRTLPMRRRVALVLAALCVVALAVQMYGLADRVTEPSPVATIDDQLLEVEARTTVPENEFVPADRDISECISALPKPGCGSEARGGWRQSLVFLAILGGLGIIAWRVVAASRRARRAMEPPVTDHRTPAATNAPGDRDGDLAP